MFRRRADDQLPDLDVARPLRHISWRPPAKVFDIGARACISAYTAAGDKLLIYV